MKITRHISKKLFVAAIASSVADSIGISLLYPLLSKESLNQIGIHGNWDFLENNINAIFLAVAISSTIFKLWYSGYRSKQVYLSTALETQKAYNNILELPYYRHLAISSGQIISHLTDRSNRVAGYKLQVTALLSAAMSIVLTLFITVVVSWKFTIAACALIAAFYISAFRTQKQKLRTLGKNIAHNQTKLVAHIQDTSNNIIPIKLEGLQKLYGASFRDINHAMRLNESKAYFLTVFPRQALEGFVLVFGGVLAMIISRDPQTLEQYLPTIAIFLVALSRLIPGAQQVFSSFAGMQADKKGVEEFYTFVDETEREQSLSQEIDFTHSIELKEVDYGFDSHTDVLKGVNLRIKKGERILILGESGSGKTTLALLLMGLLVPKSGAVFIDTKILSESEHHKLRNLFAFLPQQIYLNDRILDDVVSAKSLAGGRIMKTLNNLAVANIADRLRDVPLESRTLGENGRYLSGGQRQRLGLAKALISERPVIVFDEPTSALDAENEARVLREINDIIEPGKTLIIISHSARLASDIAFDKVLTVKQGAVQVRHSDPLSTLSNK